MRIKFVFIASLMIAISSCSSNNGIENVSKFSEEEIEITKDAETTDQKNPDIHFSGSEQILESTNDILSTIGLDEILYIPEYDFSSSSDIDNVSFIVVQGEYKAEFSFIRANYISDNWVCSYAMNPNNGNLYWINDMSYNQYDIYDIKTGEIIHEKERDPYSIDELEDYFNSESERIKEKYDLN